MSTAKSRSPLPLLVLLLPMSVHAGTIRVPSQQPTIQDAIVAASDGDSILVWPGTYHEWIDFIGKDVVLLSLSGPADTVIDGSPQGDGSDANYSSTVTFENGETRSAVIQGFTITGGQGTYLYGPICGGGILCLESSPTIRGNIITGNELMEFYTGIGERGGIYSYQGAPMIVANVISDNIAQGGAGGEGGGIWCVFGETIIMNNVICSNLAEGSGGGINCSGTSGGLAVHIVNNTIVGNSGTFGGGIDCARAVELRNCILWDNEASVSGPEISLRSATPASVLDVDYSDIEGEQTGIYVWTGSTLDWGLGMLDQYPVFEPGPLSLYHLEAGSSPCIDTGDPSVACRDFEDTGSPGYPLWPSLGLIRNDMGAFGGPLSVYWTNRMTGIGQEEGQSSGPGRPALHVSPNPASSFCIASLDLPSNGMVDLWVTDSSGRRVVSSYTGMLPSGLHVFELDLSGQPCGMYFVVSRCGQVSAMQRIVVISSSE
ncbi:MAG: hypothetical protein QUS11_07390 [Candidatus Fermentibacter sp.]|nr:hypothetical protein [Candidatus Fermentibacter sp.]